MGLLSGLFGKSKEQEMIERQRNRYIEQVQESIEIVSNSKNAKTIISRAQFMKDVMQTLKVEIPDHEFVKQFYDTVMELYDGLQQTRDIYELINKGNEQFKKKDLGDQYYDSAIEHYKSAIELMINPEIWLAGDVPEQTFKRYIAYLKKNDKTDEIENIKLAFQKLTDKKEQ